MMTACTLAVVLGVFLTATFIFSRHDGFFSPFSMFYFYMMLYYVVAPLYQMLGYGVRYHETTFWSSFVAVGLTNLFYVLLRHSKVFDTCSRWTFRIASHLNPVHDTVRKRVICGLLAGFLVYLCSIYLVYGGTVAQVFDNPLRYREEIGKGWKMLLYSLQYQLIYNLFFVYIAYRYRNGLKPFTLWMKFYAIFITVLAVSLGSRGIMIAFLFQGLAIHEIFHKRLPKRQLFMASAAMVVLFVGYLQYRNTSAASQGSVLERVVDAAQLSDEITKRLADAIINRADAFGNFDVYIGALELGQIDTKPLSSFPDALQQYVPRDFYPNKPYYFSSEMTRRLLPEVFEGGATYDFTGIAEWIHNFGFAFLPLFGIFPAIILAVAQRCYRDGDPFVSYLYVYNLLGSLSVAVINNGFLNAGNVIWLPLPLAFYSMLFLFFIKSHQSAGLAAH